MEIEFPKEQEAFLIRKVDEGRFLSIPEAVRVAVRELELRELEDERRFVAVGLEEAQRGECAPIEAGEIRKEGLRLLELRRAARES